MTTKYLVVTIQSFKRFQYSHKISVYKSRPRVIDEYPLCHFRVSLLLMRDVIMDSISDHRAVNNYWLLLEPKAETLT